MILESYRHLWGVSAPLPQFLPAAKTAGYSGIETGLNGVASQEEFGALLRETGLKFIAQTFTDGPDVSAHVDSLRRQVEAAVGFAVRPTLINVHSGWDNFSFAQGVAFFQGALDIEREYGVPIGHETHRGRILYNPWITRDLLRELPDLRLVADFSHWVCVAERFLDRCEEEVALAAERTIHVHARVGYTQGPQVTDPRAPEFTGALTAHEAWWDQVWAGQRARGVEVSTFTPEFGPPGYLHTLPYTQQPVANLPEICDWMAERQLARFAKLG
jgi:sugar phosphate isomerase/epimerase